MIKILEGRIFFGNLKTCFHKHNSEMGITELGAE